jgi:hypothetical protein
MRNEGVYGCTQQQRARGRAMTQTMQPKDGVKTGLDAYEQSEKQKLYTN